MKIRFGIPAMAALLFMPTVWAQSNAASPKVGVISVQIAIQSTAEGKQRRIRLATKKRPGWHARAIS